MTDTQVAATYDFGHGSVPAHRHTRDYADAVALLTRMVIDGLPDGHPAKEAK